MQSNKNCRGIQGVHVTSCSVWLTNQMRQSGVAIVGFQSMVPSHARIVIHCKCVCGRNSQSLIADHQKNEHQKRGGRECGNPARVHTPFLLLSQNMFSLPCLYIPSDALPFSSPWAPVVCGGVQTPDTWLPIKTR